MRKNFLTLLTMFLAIFAITSQTAAAQVSEPTLTQMWKFTEDLPDDASHKDGAGINGEFYIKSTGGSIDIWGENGNTGNTITTGTGGGIATDEAGNIIVRAEYFAGSIPSAFQIIPAGTTAPQTLTLTLSATGRVDHLACASGDVMSADGGKLYLFCTGQTSVNVITIKEGVQTECTTVAVSTTGDATSEAYPVIGDEAKFITHVRGNAAIYVNDGAGNDTKLTTPDINSTAGSCMFQLQGVNYIAYNSGTNYADGFAIANMETGEKVAAHDTEMTSIAYVDNATTANHISYEAKDENTAYIYVYTPGNMIAKYEFEVPATESGDDDMAGATLSAWCDTPYGHLGDAEFGDTSGRMLLTIEKESSNSIALTVKASPDSSVEIDYLYVIVDGIGYEVGTDEGELLDEYKAVITFETVPTEVTFSNIMWSNSNWTGRWDAGSLTVPFNTSCNIDFNDDVKPEITKAEFVSADYSSVTIALAATDKDNDNADTDITFYKVSDEGNGLAEASVYVDADGNVTVSGLSAGVTYNLVFAAVDAAGNVSDNTITVEATTVAMPEVYTVDDFEGELVGWEAAEGGYDLYIVENPAVSDNNASAYVLQGGRGAAANNWAAAMKTAIDIPGGNYKYLHVKMYRDVIATVPNAKVSDTMAIDIAPMDGQEMVAGQWQDVVFDISAYTADYAIEFLYFMYDRGELAESVIIYLDDIVLNNDPNPSTTVEVAATYPDALYMVGGNITGISYWDAADALTLAKVEETEATYEATVTFGADNGFAIAEAYGDWDTVNAKRYGTEANDQMLVDGVATAIYENSNAMKAPTGEATVTVNLEDMTITVVMAPVVYPEYVYLIGSGIEGAGTWDPEDGLAIAKLEGEDAIYYANNVVFTEETSEWKISEILASWEDNSAYLYGATEDAMIVSGVESAIAKGGSYNIKIAAGTYDLVIDLEACTVYCEEYIAPVADRAIFAYGLKATSDDDMNYITYSLNTDATSVEIIFKDAEGEVVSTIDGGIEKGENTVGISKDSFLGTGITWEVKATGAAIDAYTRITTTESDYAFYAPYGVAVDNNPESENFGNVYVTNSGNDAAGDYSLVGLAAFDPSLARYTVDGANLFNGGITARTGSTGSDFRKVKVLENGNILIGSATTTYNPIYKVDFSAVGGEWEPFLQGTLDTESTYGDVYNEDGEIIGSSVLAMDVVGSGDDQQLWVTNGFGFSFSTVRRYDIGSNDYIDDVADLEWTANEGMINYLSASMVADGLGGYWGTQYRASGNTTEPNLVHYNAEGVLDYVTYSADTTVPNMVRQGGIAIKDNLMALGGTGSVINLYTVEYDEAGAPTLTFIESFAPGIGYNMNEIAFDYAGNIHVVSNSGEWYSAYSGKTDDNTSTVPAAAAYALDFAEPTPADRAIFAYGLFAVEYDDDYELYYSLNTDATSVEIVVKDAEGTQVGEVISGGIAKGSNFVVIAKADYLGEDLSWEVTATGSAISEYAKITDATSDYAFYAPYGIAVDNNPESDQFGYIYVTNSGNDSAGDYSLVGLAAFDPSLARYEVNGSNLFNGGVTARTGGTASDFRKVSVLEDGSILVGSATTSYNPIYKTDLYSIDEEWEPFFDGTQDTESTYGYVYNGAGEVIGSSVLAMDVIGTGADQQLWVTNGFGYSFTTVCRYDIGYKSSISEVADQEWAANDGMINYTSASMRADGLGGYWGTQYRASGNDTEPNLVHYNANGELDYETYSADTTVPNMVRQGGIAIKGNLMALAGIGSVIDLYTVEYDEAGAPTLTFIESFAPGIGTNMNDIVFDYAGNIHVVTNSGEWYAAYSGKTDNNTTTVKSNVNNMLSSTFVAVAPEITEISTDDEGFITVNWTVDGAEPIYYILGLEKDGDIYKVIDGITGNSADVYLTDITETTTFDITVVAVYANGDAEESVAVSYVYEVSGVESIMAAAVSVYPNPTVDVVTIESSVAMSSVEVYSVAGALVAKVDAGGEKAVSLDIAAEAAGVYFVKIDGAKTIKVIKK